MLRVLLVILVIIIILAIIVGFARWKFAVYFRSDVKELLGSTYDTTILREQDLNSLPEPVRKYIRYTGYIGKKKVGYFKAAFEGQIRASESSPWMQFRASQYSKIDDVARYFFIKASMKGIPVEGYHRFRDGKAIMDIRAASLIKVQYAEGREMDISETVTHFNDMCLLAPGSLINKHIIWDTISDYEVRATFSNRDITVSSILQFNNKGELINFISDDRYYSTAAKTMKKARWMTPVRDYKEEAGIRFPSYGEAIWVLPEGNFTYAEMKINTIVVNPAE